MSKLNDALSQLHAVNVAIDAYVKGVKINGSLIDLVKVSNQLMKARKTLESVRET